MRSEVTMNTAKIYQFPQRLSRENIAVFAIAGMDSDVTLTREENGVYCCTDCALWTPRCDREFTSPLTLFEHMLAHRHCGHAVPEVATEEVLEICEGK